MKIWFDILTPKHLLFFEPMIRELEKNHSVLCTSRNYREVGHVAKIRKLDLLVVGRHGGAKKFDKLVSSVKRTNLLSKIIKKHSPDIAISFCSPEASRVAFGLGIKHIGFSDSPHAVAVMRLSVPLVQKLFIPWIIPKKEFTRFGIEEKDIIQYRAIDAAITLKRKTSPKFEFPFKDDRKKTILIRVEEDQAAYLTKNSRRSIEIIKKIIKEFGDQNVIVHGRYASQVNFLKKSFGKKAIILSGNIDGKAFLENTDVFVGSGGTMTAESALLGVPTISFYAVPNFIENYLIKKKLVKRETEPKKIVLAIKRLMRTSKIENRRKAKKILASMEDPFPKLVKTIKSLI